MSGLVTRLPQERSPYYRVVAAWSGFLLFIGAGAFVLGMAIHNEATAAPRAAPSNIQAIVRTRPTPLPPRVTADDRNSHRAFVRTLGTEGIWLDYFAIKNVAA